LLTERGLVPAGPLDEATGLLGQGIGLDSVEVLQLVSAIEEAYGLTIDDDELQREHFATLGTVVSFVRERLPA
jgi:acyl carrier protein